MNVGSRIALLAALCQLLPVSIASALQAEVGNAGDPIPETDAAIRAADLEAHVRFLASDELKGRPAVSAESRRAAQYLANVFEAAGLEGGGDVILAERHWFQAVPFDRVTHDGHPELTITTTDGETIEAQYGIDFSLSNPSGLTVSTGELRIVHVGEDEDVPEQADAAKALSVDGSSRAARTKLEAAGAPRGAGWGMLVRASSSNPGRAPRGAPRVSLKVAWDDDSTAPSGPNELRLRGPLVERLRAGELATVRVEASAKRERVSDSNVIGVIRGKGTDERPELAHEIVVVSAHYDHIGTSVPVEDAADGEDVIFNGADDDASGVAAVLELAEALGAREEAPARTVVFLLATAEERGILGTKWYVKHPFTTRANGTLGDTVCNLNIEMIGRPDEKAGGAGKLWFTGWERTNLGPAIAERGLDVVQDPYPTQNFFARSDNIVFVEEGIVGQTLSTYNLHRDYHNFTDEADLLDYAHMEGCTKAALRALDMLASGDVTPQWNEGEPKLGR